MKSVAREYVKIITRGKEYVYIIFVPTERLNGTTGVQCDCRGEDEVQEVLLFSPPPLLPLCLFFCSCIHYPDF